MGVLSRGESNPSKGDNPRQILALQVGGFVVRPAPSHRKNYFLKKLEETRTDDFRTT